MSCYSVDWDAEFELDEFDWDELFGWDGLCWLSFLNNLFGWARVDWIGLRWVKLWWVESFFEWV